MNFGSKDPVEVAMFLKKNGITNSVCEKFEGVDMHEVICLPVHMHSDSSVTFRLQKMRLMGKILWTFLKVR